MLSLICNYFYDKLFYKPTTGQKRKNNEFLDYPPVKQMRFDTTPNSLFKMDRSCNFQHKMQNDNLFEDEPECVITHEVFNQKQWPSSSSSCSSSMMARQSIHHNKYSSNLAGPVDKRKLACNSNHKSKLTAEKYSNINDTDTVKYTLKNCLQNNSKDYKNKPVAPSTRIFNSCETSNPKQEKEKSKLSFRNSIKKSLSLMQETYRLSEKVQYMQLLQQQTMKFNSLMAPFSLQKITDQKNRKPSIPVIDLTNEKNSVVVNRSKENSAWTSSVSKSDDIASLSASSCDGMREITKINSLQDILKTHSVTGANLIDEILTRHATESAEKKRQVEIEEAKLKILNVSNSKAYSDALEEKLRRYMRITTPALEEVEVTKEEYKLPELTKDQEQKISSVLIPSPASEILAEKFGLQIKRRDLQTLKGLNWLNDEVINFYMNLIMERGKTEGLPKVYAFNTFFYPKLVSNGHSSLKRWTKKVDIFSHDLILVPIHLGMHWCMAVIDFRSKEVRYYDSMGSPNNRCLNALLQYLEAESLDKKKTLYSTNDWKQINVEDIPQQMNGSDCGVFSCMFAEHLARDSPLLFSQDHMPYFRRKMVLEIIESKLLT